MHKQIRSLPPGVDSIDDDVIFGTMWIKVGTLKLIRTSNATYNVLCQFWGETTAAILSTRSDTKSNQQERTQRYNIKCPITFFMQYLHQMKNNLRLEVQQVGKVTFDMLKFVKKNVSIDSKQAFQNLKGFFEVIGKGNRKAGSLEIQMGCSFDPEIAIRQLGEEGIKQIRKSQMMNCPAQKLQIKQCCGQCQCVCKKPKIANKQKKQQKTNDDPRIPHSLDIHPRDQNSFDADKYQIKQQQKPIKQQHPTIIKKQSHKYMINKKSQQFPQVPKILTYSNLRLNYQDSQIPNQIQSEEKDIMIMHKQLSKQSQVKYQIKIPIQNEKNKILVGIGQSVEDSNYQIKAQPLSKEQLIKQFYGAENSPFKSNYQPIKEKSNGNFYKVEQTQRQKLSRVINLDQQLDQINKIRPPHLLATQSVNNPYSANLQFQRNIDRKNTTKSNMMLSLFLQINKSTINLPNKQPFIIAYRPYGQKQRLTLGPNFSQIINILSIVGQNEVRKMGKTPIIIQFWSSAQNKFIGLLKIDLSKIHKGFLLQDSLNQIAIKTNILPTTIERGQAKIMDLSDKQVGSCNLYSAIGTSTQLNAYLNQKQSNQYKPVEKKQVTVNIEDQQKQIVQVKKQQHNIDSKNLVISFDLFLQLLYKNNNTIIDSLNYLMNKKLIDRKQLNQLGKSIGINSLNNIFDLHKKISEQNKQNIDFHKIAQSFDDYIQVVQIVRDQFVVSSKTVRNLFRQPNQVLIKLKQQTPMRAISKRKAQQILQKFSKYHQPINQYLSKFNQYISLDILSITLLDINSNINKITDLSQFNKDYLNQVIANRFHCIVEKQKIQFKQLIAKLNEESNNQNYISAFKLWRILKGKISLWILLHFIQMINKANNQLDCEKVDLQLLNNFLQSNNQSEARDKKNQDLKIQQIIQPSQQETETRLKPIINPQPLNQSQINNNNEVQVPSQIINQNKQNSQQVLPSIKHEQQKKQPAAALQKYFKHLFSIQPTQLTLDHPFKGNCIVVYEFPYDEQQVKSKNFITSIDKHKYQLKMYGTHGFTTQEDVQNYFGDNPVKFHVKIDKRIQYEGALPSDQLLIQPNTQQNKIIPLFSQRSQGIAGKLKLSINYQKALASDNTLGKQTTYQLFLPKSGYINYSISCQLQPAKIRSQLNIRQQFYIALVLDTFYHDTSLRTQFPPCSSKLFSDSSDNAQLNGSIKLSLSPVILQYLKSNNARLSLNIIYYSKQSGNFQRKQIPYAIIQLPLINIIKSEGIKGDYAFKNKLGMFVTLSTCKLKYEKQANIKQINRDEIDKHLTSYWLILNFLQFLNFSPTKYSWIKIQFVVKGQKYCTQKLALQPYSINNLHNAALLLKLTQQQFMDVKIIPITILTNISQKLAIDINIKSINKDIIHRKYSINNQYYVVVNQNSKANRMRIGVKSYCFRGGPLLGNFVNSLYQHLNTQVFDQLQYPQQIQNYEQIVNIFKNNLKLTQKNLQQAITQLDLHRNKQKLNFQFFTNRTYYKLDFTPILTQNQSDIDFICQQLPTQPTKSQLLQYLSDNRIKLQNFRQQFLDRYYFKQLNKLKIDKNVQFLGLQNCIDLISFIRKIRILNNQNSYQNNTQMQISKYEDKVLDFTILEGMNFQKLYNGIKPNSIVRVADIGLQTQISHRNSNPYFNQHTQIQLDRDSIIMLKSLKIQVYHCTTDDQDDAENILIGQGYANVNITQLKSSAGKIIKVVLNSTMSNRMKASLSIKVGLADAVRSRRKDQSSQNIEQSADVSRFGQIMQDIRQEMAYKNKLFQSSDQDDG